MLRIQYPFPRHRQEAVGNEAQKYVKATTHQVEAAFEEEMQV
jgi:hypothetical protein